MDKHSEQTHPPEKHFVGSCGHEATNFEINRLQECCRKYREDIRDKDALLARSLAMFETCRSASLEGSLMRTRIYKLQKVLRNALKHNRN